MAWLRFLKRLYSLDTLDTRFTISSTTPPKNAVTELQIDPAKPGPSSRQSPANGRADGAGKSRDRASEVQPSLWGTPEFYFYYFCFITIVPLMFKTGYDVSKTTHPAYPKYERLLSDGWIFNRKVDNSDGQYASFRDNIPYLAVVLILHPLLRRLYDSFWRSSTYTEVKPLNGRPNSGLTMGLTSTAAAEAHMNQRISFDYWFAYVFIIALHGTSVLKILPILFINYQIAKRVPKKYMPAATWIFNILTLFANELTEGYKFTPMVARFIEKPKFAQKNHPALIWAVWLDRRGGLIPRWEVLFNITVLRLISFNLDYYWSLDMRGGSPIETNPPKKKQLDPANLSERDRVATPAKPYHYSFRNYLAYALYAPLYLAGPILTFNDYISQSRYRAPSITGDRTIRYAIRFLLALLCMELVLHYIYAVAIFSAKPDWNLYTPMQLSMLGYFNLNIIWLKLLLPWRFFRLWSLIDGIDPPENMARCMSNNYSGLAFWRGWHRSYNRWVVRYIYVPLGGSQSRGAWGKVRSILNYLAVFTFVALWHDINLRLLMWGWLITLFVLPEVLATLWARKYRNDPTTYRVLCGIGAVAQILMMMVANLVGFAIGIDGLKELVKAIVGSTWGVAFVAAACGTLFVGVQVMYEVREQEKREGIRMKC